MPDDTRRDRYRLIRKLSFYRFVALHTGFWIRPYHKSEDLENRLQELMNSAYCKSIRFRFYSKREMEKIPRLWKVAETHKRFRECIQYITKSREDYNLNDPQDALRGMMILGDIAVKQLASDPMLPDVFLPTGWQGRHLRDIFIEWTRLTYEKSKSYWKKIYQSNEQLAHVNPESYERYYKLAP